MAETKSKPATRKHRTDDSHVSPTALMFRSCGDKLGYPSKKIAKSGARHQTERGHAKQFLYLNTYKCKFCGKWHNGHSRTPSREGSDE